MKEIKILLAKIEERLDRPKLPQRDQSGIGKRIGNAHYVHKDYAGKVIPKELLLNAKKAIPKDFEYHIVKHNRDDNSISFIQSHDFETAHEPSLGDSIRVAVDGSTKHRKAGSRTQIYHHKWMFVPDDHKGFDVEQSKERSRSWAGRKDLDSKMIGFKDYWDEKMAKSEEHLAKDGINGDWHDDGLTFRVKDGTKHLGHRIFIYNGKKRVGHIAYSKQADKEGYHEVYNSNLEEAHRGKGLYQEMLRRGIEHVKSLGGKGLKSPGYQRSSDATRAWKKINPEVKPGVQHALLGEKADVYYADERHLKKAREDKLVPAEGRKAYRKARREFEGKDELANQLTPVKGVSDVGIEVRRADPKIPGAVAHGYQRVSSPEKHKATAKEMLLTLRDKIRNRSLEKSSVPLKSEAPVSDFDDLYSLAESYLKQKDASLKITKPSRSSKSISGYFKIHDQSHEHWESDLPNLKVRVSDHWKAPSLGGWADPKHCAPEYGKIEQGPSASSFPNNYHLNLWQIGKGHDHARMLRDSIDEIATKISAAKANRIRDRSPK